jgi:hypothetical protein
VIGPSNTLALATINTGPTVGYVAALLFGPNPNQNVKLADLLTDLAGDFRSLLCQSF